MPETPDLLARFLSLNDKTGGLLGVALFVLSLWALGGFAIWLLIFAVLFWAGTGS